MCLKGTGLLNKLKEAEQPFHSARLETVGYQDAVCLPDLFLAFFFTLNFEQSFPPTNPCK